MRPDAIPEHLDHPQRTEANNASPGGGGRDLCLAWQELVRKNLGSTRLQMSAFLVDNRTLKGRQGRFAWLKK